LQFSEIEVDKIEMLLNDEKLDVKKYVKTNASEESFKALSGKAPDIIHISTHGFYYQPYMQDFRSDYSNSYFSKRKKDILDFNGLLFSGANNAWKNNQYQEDVEDGVLTAREISQLNLSSTDLVALSACQTGLGELHDVDGNNGLLRAFKIAGVDKIIITLWNVSDNATAIFMESFYKNLFKGYGAKSALDETIKQVKKDMPDSYYWAPFVLIE
jgi:CHAT domain-containing protein